jgi:amino acid transporter
VAFQAMVSIATIGLYIAYALPIFFRVTLARKHFVPGPFNLGRYGVVVGWVAIFQSSGRYGAVTLSTPTEPLEIRAFGPTHAGG